MADENGAASADSQNNGSDAAKANGSAFDAAAVLAGLEPDNREWLAKQGYDFTPEGASKLAKTVYNQEKLLGNAIRLPGKDATPEQRADFLNKLGRPQTVEGYEFAAPKELPENMPYDGERATRFKSKAHEIGLTKEQAATLHDWFVEESVGDFKNVGAQREKQIGDIADAETEKLVKLWGPLDGATARANLEAADRFLKEAGGQEVIDELTKWGFITKDKVILSAPMAQLFAKTGMALYAEDGVLKGDAGSLDNPFKDGPTENRTKQMQLIRNDPDRARTLIIAAGKKPEDLGLKA